MKRHRRFSLAILGFAGILLIYNAVVWNLFTRDLLAPAGGVHVGDLARLGYLPGYVAPRQNLDTLPRRHMPMEEWDGKPVDVVTIGDSFSNGGGSGLNRHYQDYLATYSNLRVLNLGRLSGGGKIFGAIAALHANGLLERMQPKYLLVEIAERNCYRYAGPIDPASFSLAGDSDTHLFERKTEPADVDDEETGNSSKVGFINTGNLKWLIYSGLYHFSPNAYFSDVYRVPLDRHLFSGINGNTLVFFGKDVEKAKKHNPTSVQGLNENLNLVAKILRERGTELVFMPAPDKYSLYFPYIAGKSWPESCFFELLRQQKKEYRFIDTLAILTDELRKGEKDIYHLDDTHWSWKASKAIFLRERLGVHSPAG